MKIINMRLASILFMLVTFSGILNGQNNSSNDFCKSGDLLNFGIEGQFYPAGVIPGISADIFIRRNLAINTRLGVNFADRHSWGVNDDEYGFGYGGTIGLRYFQRPSCKGFFGGIRLDVWREKIHWINYSFLPSNGYSKILVVQPTIEIGYLWRNIKNSGFGVGFNTAMGFEINAITKGKPVGQGLINLIGILFTYNVANKGRTPGNPSF